MLPRENAVARQIGEHFLLHLKTFYDIKYILFHWQLDCQMHWLIIEVCGSAGVLSTNGRWLATALWSISVSEGVGHVAAKGLSLGLHVGEMWS